MTDEKLSDLAKDLDNLTLRAKDDNDKISNNELTERCSKEIFQ